MDWTNLAAAGIGSITTISALFIEKYVDKNWSNKNKKNDEVNNEFSRYIDVADIVNQELALLRDKYGFNRVSLIEFHNGTSSLKGVSFKNASMRFEKIDNITNSIILQYQNIPCSLSADLLKRLDMSEEGYVKVDECDDDSLVIFNKIYGVVQSYNFRLGDSLTNGSISLCSTHDKVDLSKSDINDIKAICQKIHLIRTKIIKK